jgi:hypothetical protein
MKQRLCFLGALLAALPMCPLSLVEADGPEKVVLDKAILPEAGIEVAPRGPIHEAFAQPFRLNPEPGPLVAKQPPAPVPELPPDQKPEGDNVQWIPGYWAWDSERNDYLWVSGIYRNMPPGRKYIPGYWAHTDDGFRWVPGYFAPEQQAEVPLVPQPPASLDNGPSIPPSDSNTFYTPGVWVYNGVEFVWRPGFWSAFRPDRIWISSCYVWTPGGYIFVNGYWDYPLLDRGLLFTPIYFTDPLWLRPGWFWRPRLVLGWGFNNLWCGPGFSNFFFGNFFGPHFARAGFRPWFAGPVWGNSLFAFHSWQNRNNPAWAASVRQGFNNPRNMAPTFTPLNQARTGLVNVSNTQMNVQKTNVQNFRQLAQTRNRLESSAAKQGNGVKTMNFSTGKTTVAPARITNLNAINQGGNTFKGVNTIKPSGNTINQGGNSVKQGGNTFKTQNLNKGSFTPKLANTGNLPKQALTGQSSSAYRLQTNSANSNKGSQGKSGITGSQGFSKTPTYNYRTNPGSTYRPSSTQLYRPSTSTYRPSTSTYRPSTSYRPSMNYRPSSSGYRGSSGSRGGGGHSSGGRGGGHR